MAPPTGHSVSSQRGETPPRSRPGRVTTRHASAERERLSAGSRQSPLRATANSAGTAHRSNLPTPIK
ncbi:unnamed protein product [Toxocara canis]|nr:unnamed protein product [Toxocara canis]